MAARDDAVRETEQLRHEVSQLRAQLDAAQQNAKEARAEAEEADRARVRAEATSDTLCEVLDANRRQAAERDNEQSHATKESGVAERTGTPSRPLLCDARTDRKRRGGI